MLRFLIQGFDRLTRELGWIHHYHHSHGLTSLRDWYLCFIGFAPQKYDAYNLDQNDRRDYVSDKTRFFGLPRVHGDYMAVLHDKSLLHATLRHTGYEEHLPTQHRVEDILRIHELDVDDGTYVLKPARGSSGKNLQTVTVQDGRIDLERDVSVPSQEEDDHAYVLEEKLENPGYSKQIFDESLNTIRIITAWDPDSNAPFIVAAAHRFGTHRSAPVDNISQGGVFAPIDRTTGRLQTALDPHGDGAPRERDTHPDTGAQICGTRVEGWDDLQTFIKTVAADLPNNKLIGWDVVVDDVHTCAIVEANPTPDFIGLQRNKPLLRDDRMRSFLEQHSLL